MKIVAFGELHYVDGRTGVHAVIENENGSTFNLPISKEQLDVLVAHVVAPEGQEEHQGEIQERPAVEDPGLLAGFPVRPGPARVDDDAPLRLAAAPNYTSLDHDDL